MKKYDALELAARNLRESILRNGLTTMGIAVGVASLVAMLALGVGLQQLANRRLASSGLFDSVVIFQRDMDQPPGPRNLTVEQAPARVVDEAARLELAKLPGVAEVNPEIRFMAQIVHGKEQRFGLIAAVAPSSKGNDVFDNMKGKFFSSDEAEEAILKQEFAEQMSPGKPEALIGSDLVLRYAERTPMAATPAGGMPMPNAQGGADFADWGFSVVPREQRLRVVGIAEQEPVGAMRGMTSGRVMIPLGLALKLKTMAPNEMRNVMRTAAAQGRTYQSLVVKLKNPNAVQGVEDAAKKMGFGAFSLLDASRNLRRFFTILDLFLGIFGSLALAVASLGIVNTLVMAILERRREIGIMKAIGGSDADVKLLFFAEAAAMGFSGGVLGVALGWTIGAIINFGTNVYLKQQQLPTEQIWSTPWWLGFGAIAFSILVSLISGLYPAARAARLDPVQALRYE